MHTEKRRAVEKVQGQINIDGLSIYLLYILLLRLLLYSAELIFQAICSIFANLNIFSIINKSLDTCC